MTTAFAAGSQGVWLAVHDLTRIAAGEAPEEFEETDGRMDGETDGGTDGEADRQMGDSDVALDDRPTQPTLLFCHGTGMHALTWLPVVRELGQTVNCLGLDFRGHGYAQTPPGVSFGWEFSRDDLLAVVDSLTEQGLILDAAPLYGVGHSMGAAVIIHAQLARPGLFDRVWLYEPVLPLSGLVEMPDSADPSDAGAAAKPKEIAASDGKPARSSVRANGARRRRANFASRQEAFDHYSSRPALNVLREDALWDYVNYGLADLPDGSAVLRCDPEWEAQTFEGSLMIDPDTLTGWQTQAAIVTGGTDSPVGVFGRQASRLMSQSQLTVMEQLGHFGPLQDPTGAAEHISQWFS